MPCTPSSDASASPPFPITRLYRHALESVLSFSSLPELNRLQLVCKGWMAAARTAPSVRGSMPDRYPLSSVLASPLLRHVTRWRCDAQVQLDNAMLDELTKRLPQMDEIDCRMFRPLAKGETLRFPQRLRRVDLLVIRPAKAFDLNSAMRSLSELPALETLSLQLSHLVPAVNFDLLTGCAMLRALELRWARSRQELTDAHVDSIRRIASLESLSIEGMDLPLLTRLTRRPHTLRWRRITSETGEVLIDNDNEAREALWSLPSLQFLRARLVGNTADFLSHLPQLTSLHLDCYAIESASQPEILARGLRACALLTHLHLRAGYLTSQLLEQCLCCMSRLQRLELWSQDRLVSLRFLSSSPGLASSLLSLELNICLNLHPSELRHLDALQSLIDCRLHECFGCRLRDAELASLTPPSARLPRLQTFEYTHEFWTWRSLEAQRQAMVAQPRPALGLATVPTESATGVGAAVSRLHSEHLQRIFPFCDERADLQPVATVCRSWAHAVKVMRLRRHH